MQPHEIAAVWADGDIGLDSAAHDIVQLHGWSEADAYTYLRAYSDMTSDDPMYARRCWELCDDIAGSYKLKDFLFNTGPWRVKP